MVTRGRFISLEGGEGAGKSTLAQGLKSALSTHNIEALITREPGGTPNAEAIRDLLVNGETDRWSAMSEALLLYAARRDHVDRLIEPALAAGQWVISDRFADSTRAYQGAAGNLSSERIEALHELVLGGFEPDLTLILDLDPKTGMNRTLERGEAVTRFEAHEPGFHKALRDGFLAIAQSHPERCVVIDANQSAQDVLEHAMSAVRDRIGLGDG